MLCCNRGPDTHSGTCFDKTQFTHLKFLSDQSYVKVSCETRKTKSTGSVLVPLARASSVFRGGCAACCAVREADQPARLAEGSSTSKLENLSLQHLNILH